MEELYRSLYAKYAAGLSSEDMDAKVQYALQQDPNQFIDSFYKKYTGSGPSEDQIGYMNSYLELEMTYYMILMVIFLKNSLRIL